jgi:uncharacterized membrane protein
VYPTRTDGASNGDCPCDEPPVAQRAGAPRSARGDRIADSALSPDRVAGVDAIRGFALCLMFVYHFTFDLRFYRVIAADFENDLFWLGFRALIVTMFMALVGVSLVLADRAGATASHFWRRVAVIGACALAVSVASWLTFPRSFIYFGILHCIAVASVLAWPLVRRPGVAFAIGCAVIIAGIMFSHPIFDTAPALGLRFRRAQADHRGLRAPRALGGRGVPRHRTGKCSCRALVRCSRTAQTAPAWLRWFGRHSLAVYMVHQPILLGLLWLIVGH